MVGEIGNFTETYADCVSRLINPPSLEPIPVTRFGWSGENHHLGRADAMIAFLDDVISAPSKTGGRVLVLAHSHGGNVMALMSQLLGGDASMRDKFFDATRMHYRSPMFRRIDLPAWQRMKDWLQQIRPSDLTPFDVVTFGAPLRYRWNLKVCTNVLHVVNHRSMVPDCPHQAHVPTSLREVLDADGGDYVQQLGIAGTDFLPSPVAYRDWIVEHRLSALLEPGARRRDLVRKLKLGQRVALDGTTLLVDYPENEFGWNRKLFGHGVYTCSQWIPFHLQEICGRFYAET